MLESRNRGASEASKERIEEANERLGSDATVYTTAYGTQYISPIDALFSRVEMLGFLEEARTVAGDNEENGT